MICLNPQLKLEGLQRSFKDKFKGLKIDDLLKYTKAELQQFSCKISDLEKSVC